MGRPVFGETPTPPAWRNTYREKQQGSFARGIHPMTGQPLRTDGTTCGTCTFLLERDGNTKTYFKCERSKPTGGPATDVRKKWPACALYDRATEGND